MRINKNILILVYILIITLFVVGAERLPIIGGDQDTWGDILNNWLSVAHTENGTLKKGINGSFLNLNASNLNIISTSLNYHNLTGFPTCSGSDKLTFDGSDFSCSSDQQGAGGTVTGVGRAGNITYWESGSTLGNSSLFQSGANIGIGTQNINDRLVVNGKVNITDGLNVTGGLRISELISCTSDIQTDSNGNFYCGEDDAINTSLINLNPYNYSLYSNDQLANGAGYITSYTETDPIYSPLNDSNIFIWNTTWASQYGNVTLLSELNDDITTSLPFSLFTHQNATDILDNSTINRSVSLDGYNKSISLNLYNQSISLDNYISDSGGLSYSLFTLENATGLSFSAFDYENLTDRNGTDVWNYTKLITNKIGIGQEPTTYPLEVNGDITMDGSLRRNGDIGTRISYSSGQIDMYGSSTHFVRFDNSPSEILINPSGSIGRINVNGTLDLSNITLTNNCANGQILKWSDGFGICGTDNTAIGGSGSTYNIENFTKDYTNMEVFNIQNGTALPFSLFTHQNATDILDNSTINRSVSLDDYNKSISLSPYNYSLFSLSQFNNDAGFITASTGIENGSVIYSPKLTAENIIMNYSGDSGSSTSVGGAFRMDNTNNVGLGMRLYTNQGATADGRLLNIRVDNSAFDQAGLHVDYDGNANAIEFVCNNDDSSSQCLNVVSNNPLDTTFSATGNETNKATAKIVHNKPVGVSDVGSAVMSLISTGISTASHLLFGDAEDGTIGDLLNLRTSGSERIVVESNGNTIIAGSFSATDINSSGIILQQGIKLNHSLYDLSQFNDNLVHTTDTDTWNTTADIQAVSVGGETSGTVGSITLSDTALDDQYITVEQNVFTNNNTAIKQTSVNVTNYYLLPESSTFILGAFDKGFNISSNSSCIIIQTPSTVSSVCES